MQTVKEKVLNLRDIQFLKHVINFLPGSIVPALLNFISIAIFARILTIEEFGLYSLIIATAAIFTATFGEWIKQALSRFLPDQKNIFELNLIKNSSHFGIIISIFLIVIISIASVVVNSNLRVIEDQVIIISTIFIVINIYLYNLLAILQTELKSKQFSRFQVILSFSKLLFALIFIYIIAEDALSIILGTSLGMLLILIILFKYLNYSYSELNKNLVSSKLKKIFKKMFIYGWPFIFWYLGSQILNVGDRYIIQYFLTTEDVGIYSGNYSIIQGSLALMAAPILLVLSPTLIKMLSQNEFEKAEVILSRITNYYLIICFPILLFLFTFGRDIISFILGPEYSQGYLLGLISFGVIIWQIGNVGHKVLEFERKSKLMMYFCILCALINIILNIILIPIFGLYGSAIATIISYLIYCILVYLSALKSVIRWRISTKTLIIIIAVSLFNITVSLLLKNHTSFSELSINISLYLLSIIIFLKLIYNNIRFEGSSQKK